MRADPSRLKSVRIAFEDDAIVVVDKPSGMSVHPGEGAGRSLIEVLPEAYAEPTPFHLAHRLDRGTSGLVVLAKSKAALDGLTRRWGQVDKAYLAVVIGDYRGPKILDRPLPDEDGIARAAQTEVRVLEVLSGVEPTVTLLVARIETGRTHQIRRHLEGAKHPILLDDRHGNFSANKAWSRAIKAQGGRTPPKGGLFLHAARLVLPEGTVIWAPPPAVWAESLGPAGLKRDLLDDPG
ncbi:MAG: RNA pseudouridine synthase [Myxococcota bacterium]